LSNLYLQRLEHYNPQSKIRLTYNIITPELKEKIKILKKDIYEKKGTIKNFRHINPPRDEELAHLTEGFNLLFDTELISAPSLFDNIKLNEKDIDEILASYFVAHRNLNVSEASKYLVAALYLKYLIKAYKKVKEHYFKNNRETLFLELESLEKERNELKQENVKLQQLTEEQKKLIGELKQKLDAEYSRAKGEFAETIRKLEKQNEQLKAELEADKNELTAFSFSQCKTSGIYKAYISNRLDKDIRNLMIAIQENNRVYETILESGKISKDQMNTLMWHNGQIRDIILECRNLAVELNMRKEEFQYDKTGVNAIKITRVFYELLFEEEIYENEIELDLKLKLIITKMYELNSKWNSIINNFKIIPQKVSVLNKIS